MLFTGIVCVASHAGPAEHFAQFAAELGRRGHRVEVVARGVAEQRVAEVMGDPSAQCSCDDVGALAQACRKARIVMTDVGDPFSVQLQEALRRVAPGVLRLAYYDNREGDVPGEYRELALRTIDVAHKVMFVNESVALRFRLMGLSQVEHESWALDIDLSRMGLRADWAEVLERMCVAVKQTVAQAIAPIFVHPDEDGGLETQALYGAVVEAIPGPGSWMAVRCADGAQGWVQAEMLSPRLQAGVVQRTTSCLAYLYATPDVKDRPVEQLPYGSAVELIPPLDRPWQAVRLLQGEETAWIQRGDLEGVRRRCSLETMLDKSRQFLGQPYYWGGITSQGWDCSGLVQMLYREMGVELPRNSYEQVDSPLLRPVDGRPARGDLLFFDSGNRGRISHVGIYFGSGLLLHATGDGSQRAPGVRLDELRLLSYKSTAIRRLKEDA